MDAPSDALHRADGPSAVLEGGPADLPAELRLLSPLPADRTYKVPFRGGYEHFELVEEDADDVRVFRWTMRTKIAE